jgi:hypothetical protein
MVIGAQPSRFEKEPFGTLAHVPCVPGTKPDSSRQEVGEYRSWPRLLLSTVLGVHEKCECP